MIIGIAYPYPPYALDRDERVFTIIGKPHQYYALTACKGVTDKFYVLTSKPEVVAVAQECGYTIMPWELLDKSEGLLPGHQMASAMMDFIKADLGMDCEMLMRQQFLHMNLANVLVRRQTLLTMRDISKQRSLPYLYLSMRIREAVGVVGADAAMVSVLNDAPIQLEDKYVPSVVRFEQATNFSCERNIVPGQQRHFAHQVSELEGLRVDSETKAALASLILKELPDYHLMP